MRGGQPLESCMQARVRVADGVSDGALASYGNAGMERGRI